MEDITPWLGVIRDLGVVGVVFLLIATGRLLPRWWVDKLLADKDAALDRQQETLDRQQESIDVIARTQPQILEYMETSNHALTSIQRHAEDGTS